MSIPKIPYQLMKNPTQAQLLAMIKISIETLKDFDFMLASNPMTCEKCINAKEVLPTILIPFFHNSLVSRPEFDAWVDLEQRRLNRINGLPELQNLGENV